MEMDRIKSVAVFGAGSWGTALACLLAERGLGVQFWGRDEALMTAISETRENHRYLPGVALPNEIDVVVRLDELRPVDMGVFVVPSRAMRSSAEAVFESGALVKASVVVSCAKGIEMDSGLRMSQILSGFFEDALPAVLTGPNHAEEVGRKLATAAVVACADAEMALALQQVFTLPWFRSYRTDDVVGAEWGAALKNPYAIAAGIALGLKLGDNAIAALVTRALAEMVRFGMEEGGRAETFYGLSGVGDLMATCFSELSRNHRVGVQLGEGRSLEEITAATSMVAEGVPNTASLFQAARAKEVRTPLLDEIHSILYRDKSPMKAMQALLSRDPKRETD